jgi:hypothetical protein
MSERQMPSIDIGLHLGARAGAMGTPLDEAEAVFVAEKKPSPYVLGRFRTGYIIGQINDRLNYLRSWQGYLNREELAVMLADIAPIADKWGFSTEGQGDPDPRA